MFKHKFFLSFAGAMMILVFQSATAHGGTARFSYRPNPWDNAIQNQLHNPYYSPGNSRFSTRRLTHLDRVWKHGPHTRPHLSGVNYR